MVPIALLQRKKKSFIDGPHGLVVCFLSSSGLQNPSGLTCFCFLAFKTLVIDFVGMLHLFTLKINHGGKWSENAYAGAFEDWFDYVDKDFTSFFLD